MTEKNKYCDPCWKNLPDNVTLHIFSFLGATSLFQVGRVCKSWLRVAYDELLWKALFYRHWEINRSVSMAPGKQSWVQEYKRLLYHTPSVESEVLKHHTDEVLHVCFSHNGKMFATSSKDGFIMVWNTCYPTSLKYKADMKPFFWEYTLFSQFNYNDTLLLVSGGPKIVQGTSTSPAGEIAIFSLEEGFEMKNLVENKPYSAATVWLNDFHFLSCHQQAGSNGNYSVLRANKAYEDNVSESGNEQMKLLVLKNINYFATPSGIVANCFNYNEHTVPYECQKDETGNNVKRQRTSQINVNVNTVYKELANRNASRKFENDKGEKNSVQKQSKILYINPEGLQEHVQAFATFASRRVDTSNERMKETSEYDTDAFKFGQTNHMDLTPQANNLKKTESDPNTGSSGSLSHTNSRDCGDIDDIDLANHERSNECQITDSKQRTSDDLSRMSEDNCFQNFEFTANFKQNKNVLKLEETYLIFATETKAITPHQIGIKRLKSLSTVKECGHPLLNATEKEHGTVRNGECYDAVDHLIEMHGHILGICLSPDHRYLYVNCRSWPQRYEIKDPRYPPKEAEDLDIFVIDLFTLKKTRTVHRGHMGSTACSLLLDLDVCDEYVASGAENFHGYLWDRHYGLCLRKYPHDDVVSSIAFNPTDPEVLVTVSDDCTIKIWRSLNRQREVTNAYSTESNMEHKQHIRDDMLDEQGTR